MLTRIVDNIWRLEKSVGANAYLIQSGETRVLIDPGMKSGAQQVLAELEDHKPVSYIFLTHYDADHSGAAAYLQRELGGVPVFLGTEDIPILLGQQKPATMLRKIFTTIGHVDAPQDLRPIEGGTEIVPGIQMLASPGHTPGHYAFLSQGVLVTGDAATTKQGQGLRPFASFMHTDRALAARSFEKLQSLEAAWLAPGHGAVVNTA